MFIWKVFDDLFLNDLVKLNKFFSAYIYITHTNHFHSLKKSRTFKTSFLIINIFLPLGMYHLQCLSCIYFAYFVSSFQFGHIDNEISCQLAKSFINLSKHMLAWELPWNYNSYGILWTKVQVIQAKLFIETWPKLYKNINVIYDLSHIFIAISWLAYLEH